MQQLILTFLARKKHFRYYQSLYLIPFRLMTPTEAITSLCPSNICVHSPAAFHTLKEDKSQYFAYFNFITMGKLISF